MRKIRPHFRRTMIALLAIAVNVPALGAASICTPAQEASRSRLAKGCCVRKVAASPCCCSRAGYRGQATVRIAVASHPAPAACLCRSEVPPTPARHREAPTPDSRTMPDALGAVAPYDAPTPTAPHPTPTASDLTPSHVPLYLGNARLLI